MALQPRGLHASLRESRAAIGPHRVGVRAVQPPAQRAVVGPNKPAVISSGDSAPRPVGRPQDCGEVRAKLKDLGFAFNLGDELGPLPPTLREVPAGIRRGKHCAPASAHCKRGDLFLDLFGGVGRVGKLASQRGGPNTLLLDFHTDMIFLSATPSPTLYVLRSRGG